MFANLLNKNLKIKILRENVILPEYATKLSSGLDVRAYSCEVWNLDQQKLIKIPLIEIDGVKCWKIPAYSTVLFKTGISIAIPHNCEIQLRARSGYSLKSPMRLSNGVATIDEDYRGEIGIIMDNNGFYGDWIIPYKERLAQIIVCPIKRPKVKNADKLNKTIRGTNGFGSTGTN